MRGITLFIVLKLVLIMINSYRFGNITVKDAKYNADLIIFPDHVEDKWWRLKGHELHVSDLKSVFDYEPEVLVVGKGAYGLMKITEEAVKLLDEKDIRVVARKTKEACEEFNFLLKEGKKVVAALHLTC